MPYKLSKFCEMGETPGTGANLAAISDSRDPPETMPCLPPTTGNALYASPIKMVMTGGWRKWMQRI